MLSGLNRQNLQFYSSPTLRKAATAAQLRTPHRYRHLHNNDCGPGGEGPEHEGKLPYIRTAGCMRSPAGGRGQHSRPRTAPGLPQPPLQRTGAARVGAGRCARRAAPANAAPGDEQSVPITGDGRARRAGLSSSAGPRLRARRCRSAGGAGAAAQPPRPEPKPARPRPAPHTKAAPTRPAPAPAPHL